MIAPARVAAYRVLSAVSAGRALLPDVLAATRHGLPDDRDKALTGEIAIGVQRWRSALDHVVAHASKRPIDRLDPEVLEILRLSAYQLLYLTRIPASAVVDDAVKLTGRVGKQSARGLVNAVLRTISRERDSLPLPARPDDPEDREASLAYLSVTLSHPRWLVSRWYGTIRLRSDRSLASVQQRTRASYSSSEPSQSRSRWSDRLFAARRYVIDQGAPGTRCRDRPNRESLDRRRPPRGPVRRPG